MLAGPLSNIVGIAGKDIRCVQLQLVAELGKSKLETINDVKGLVVVLGKPSSSGRAAHQVKAGGLLV